MSAQNKAMPMWIAYSIIIILIFVGVTLFALLYRGMDVETLHDPKAEFDEALESAQAMDIPNTPAPTKAPVAASLAGRIFPFYKEGLWGYKNTLNQVVIQPTLTEAQEFEDGVAFAKVDGLYGLLSINNVWLTDPCWTNIRPFSDGYAAVELNEKWGYIDKRGNVVIDYQFRDAGSFHCGRAMARSGSAYGYIDIMGEFAVSTRWREAGDFSEDLAFATSDEYEADRHYIINKVGEKVATLGSHVQGTIFSEGFAVVIEKKNTYYYMNASGQSAFRTTFLDAKAFANGLAAVKTAEGWGYIDDTGTLVIPGGYMQAESFSDDGLAAVLDASTGKWGYINKKGAVTISPAYDSAQSFKEGYAIVSKGQDYYLLDMEGAEKLVYTM